MLLKRRCTSPRCNRCQSGEGHPTWYLSRKVEGKTRLTYLPKENLHAARRGVKHYARVRTLLAEIAEVNAEGLKASALPKRAPKSPRRKGKTGSGSSRGEA